MRSGPRRWLLPAIAAGAAVALAATALGRSPPGGDEPIVASGAVTSADARPLVPDPTPSPDPPPTTVDSTVASASGSGGGDTQTAPDRPTRVRIPSIDVDADVIDLGLNPDRTLEVPADFDLTGWWTGRSVPGEPGPSIVVGHVDSKAGPAVFHRLRELEPGDVVEIDRSDGSVARFAVTESVTALKTDFPTEQVYGEVEGTELRLITCGGDFDGSAGSYVSNVIVFAEHLGNQPPTWAAAAD